MHQSQEIHEAEFKQAQEFHEKESKLAEDIHNKEFDRATDMHEEELLREAEQHLQVSFSTFIATFCLSSNSLRFFVSSCAACSLFPFQDMTSQLRESQKESDRDIWEQQSTAKENSMTVAALLLAGAFSMAVEGQLPSDPGYMALPDFLPGVPLVRTKEASISCLVCSSLRVSNFLP